MQTWKGRELSLRTAARRATSSNEIFRLCIAVLGREGETARNNGTDPVLIGDGTPGDPYRTIGDHGHAGTGIWSRGSNNYYRDNVIANAAYAGTFIWTRSTGSRNIPAAPGQTPMIPYRILEGIPLEFASNEAYASSVAFAFGGARARGCRPV